MNRREFVGGVVASAAALPSTSASAALQLVGDKPEYHAFSRVFQFIRDPYRAAALLRSCGYDGVEWTVRPGGFVEPEDAMSGLKRVKAAADSAGLKAESIVVSFTRGDDDGAVRVAMAAAEAGFRSFRGNYFRYDRTKSHLENMDSFRRGFDSLEALAKRSGLKACYQNHSTYSKDVPLFGSLVWDLACVVSAYDPRYVGVQYDPMHVRAEGGPSWDHTLGAVARWVDFVCLKDFHFEIDETGRDWRRVLVPAGRGIVDFAELARLMKIEKVSPRYTVHYDYDFPSDEQAACMYAKRDLAHYRSILG